MLKLQIEFLPVYSPTKAERADARLYANNIQLCMANALDLPLSEKSVVDNLHIPTEINHI